MKNKWKQNIALIAALFAVLLSMFNPALFVLADSAYDKFDKQSNEYLEDTNDITDVLEKMGEDAEGDEVNDPDKNTMAYVMKRLFYPGIYINDVEHGVLSTDLGLEREDILYLDRYACNPNEPSTLVYHNCNIPNFTTELIQNIIHPYMPPFNNAEKTIAYPPFGLGIPKGIPGGEVPVVRDNNTPTYTALEIYGYDLKLTSYNGEWDRITTSNEARMLSNFGVIDKISLFGTGLWNSVKAGVSSLVNNFTFNPLRWIGNIGKAFTAAVAGGLNTALDTSDLNVVATKAWKRESLNNTLYNVYVLSDREILNETYKLYFKLYTDDFMKKVEDSDELAEVVELDYEKIPPFKYDEAMIKGEAEASEDFQREIDRIRDHNNMERYKTMEDPHYFPEYLPLPSETDDVTYYTEQEQLGFWAEENATIIEKASQKKLIEDVEKYENYESLVEDWTDRWSSWAATEFDAHGETIEDLLKKADKDVFLNNPHIDPKQAIGHYACTNDEGGIARDKNGNIIYMYVVNEDGKVVENTHSACKRARQPIGAGLFGSGWTTKAPLDTRHIDQVSNDFLGLKHKFSGFFLSLTRTFSSFVAKITNVVLDLSFSPLLKKLGIDTIVAKLVEGFRDTVFFPLAVLLASIGALLVFFQLLKNGSAWQLLGTIVITFIIFIVGAVFLLTPNATLKIVDEIPDKIDNFIADAVLVDDDGNDYCSTGNEGGIRSAQCNVWGAMVFEPWVYLQFGTNYDNLYALGTTGLSSNQNTMQNTSVNAELVGDAAVNRGGGVVEHNWAMYQLDKTKAGTITSMDTESFMSVVAGKAVGKIDKDLYRLVDLQAGPEGSGFDDRYFDVWSGASGANLLTLLVSIIQSIFMFVAIGGLGIAKIEATFMFAISLIFLPIMLLYALLPQGKLKLKSYLSNLGNLLIRRWVVVIMLSVLLKSLTLSYARIESLAHGGLIAIAICLAFIMYKKEFLSMLSFSSESGQGVSGGNLTQVKQVATKILPQGVKQRYEITKSRVKGAGAGFVGGVVGSVSTSASVSRDKSRLKKEIRDLNKKEEQEELTEIERVLRDEFEKEVKELEKIQEAGGLFKEGKRGAREAGSIIGRTSERKIRREGHSIDRVYLEAKKEVTKKGADSITDKEPTTLDTYKEILSHSESNKSKTSKKRLSMEESRLLRDPRIQKELRKKAKEREELIKKEQAKKDFTAISPDKEELEKIAKMIDTKRRAKRIKGTILDPAFEKQVQAGAKPRKDTSKITSKSEEIKEQIIEAQERQKEAEEKVEGEESDKA